MTLKEYATKNNISYEAVRQQVKRYSEELKNHVEVINRVQYLDQFAVEFLDHKRKNNIVAVYNQEKNENQSQLEKEVNQLKGRLAQRNEDYQELLNRLDQTSKQLALLDSLEKEKDELKNKLQTSEDKVNELKPLIQTVDGLNKKVNELETQIEYLNNLSLLQLIKYKLKKKK